MTMRATLEREQLIARTDSLDTEPPSTAPSTSASRGCGTGWAMTHARRATEGGSGVAIEASLHRGHGPGTHRAERRLALPRVGR
jgi:hypothetical protein